MAKAKKKAIDSEATRDMAGSLDASEGASDTKEVLVPEEPRFLADAAREVLGEESFRAEQKRVKTPENSSKAKILGFPKGSSQQSDPVLGRDSAKGILLSYQSKKEVSGQVQLLARKREALAKIEGAVKGADPETVELFARPIAQLRSDIAALAGVLPDETVWLEVEQAHMRLDFEDVLETVEAGSAPEYRQKVWHESGRRWRPKFLTDEAVLAELERRGIPKFGETDETDPFEFVRAEYGDLVVSDENPWGSVFLHHIKAYDPNLYRPFQQKQAALMRTGRIERRLVASKEDLQSLVLRWCTGEEVASDATLSAVVRWRATRKPKLANLG